jgi:hypothetical protein
MPILLCLSDAYMMPKEFNMPMFLLYPFFLSSCVQISDFQKILSTGIYRFSEGMKLEGVNVP